MSTGFKLSRDLLAHLSAIDAGMVIDTAVRVLDAVRTQVGDHVQHNVYFRDFPANVPDTYAFWTECLAQALLDPTVRRSDVVIDGGGLNLLALPAYGRYLHTYEDLLAAHDELIEGAGDRVTVLQLGRILDEEAADLYLSMAGRATTSDVEDLQLLATYCADGPQPETIPIRENRAVINVVRLATGRPLLVDTVTDVLRLACLLSEGDVTLELPTRFRKLGRPTRRALLEALDSVIAKNEAKLGDIPRHQEQWKRLGERLHPHEYPRWPAAAAVFAVARGERVARSFASRYEEPLRRGDLAAAVAVLRSAPGLLFRTVDRLLRADGDKAPVLEAVEAAAGRVSGRVLLSVREHLQNRAAPWTGARIFANRAGRGWATPDTRPPIEREVLTRVLATLDAGVRKRLPVVRHLVIDPDVLSTAIPLSGKAIANGFGVLPRGSVTPVNGELLRFFVYWKENERVTDYDLSALFLDANFDNPRWIAWTNLREIGAAHSGDLTSAPNGASELIDLDLGKVDARYLIPQVHIYDGEGFDEVDEAFFGFMLRDSEQKGRPFEPRTVRMKSDLTGSGRVTVPLVFMRGDDGRWRAKWTHLNLRGRNAFNQVEGNRVTASRLTQAVLGREYLTMRYLTDLLAATAETVTVWTGQLPEGPVTYVGLERPDGLHPDSDVYPLARLGDLVPA